MNPPSSSLPEFTVFPKLPAETRSQIWDLASPLRQRVIQISYDTEQNTWNACKDACGGLPSTAYVCREARTVALKTYTQVFDTFIDFEIDTIFVSDPLFVIRAPRQMFLDSEHARKIQKLACCRKVFVEMHEAHDAVPDLCDGPATMLRRLDGLLHFTMVISEDLGEVNLYILDDLHLDVGDHDRIVHDLERDLEDEESGAADPTPSESLASYESRFANLHSDYTCRTWAMKLEKASNDEDEDVQEYVDALRLFIISCFFKEKEEYPEWVRPSLGIKVVLNGLAPLNKFKEICLQPEDHDFGELEWWAEFNSDVSEFGDFEGTPSVDLEEELSLT